MFKIRFYVIYVIFIIIFIELSGCVSNLENQIIQENETADSLSADLFTDILQNNCRFIFKGKNIYLNDFLNDEFDNEHTFYADYFTILNMDNDDIPEVILQIGPTGERLVLHYENDIVYGYHFGLRVINDLKKDGTFHWSGGAAYNGFGRLQFVDNKCEINEISRYDNQLSYINDKQVSEDIYFLFQNEQLEKEDVEWYSFSEETISTDFVKAWDNLKD